MLTNLLSLPSLWRAKAENLQKPTNTRGKKQQLCPLRPTQSLRQKNKNNRLDPIPSPPPLFSPRLGPSDPIPSWNPPSSASQLAHTIQFHLLWLFLAAKLLLDAFLGVLEWKRWRLCWFCGSWSGNRGEFYRPLLEFHLVLPLNLLAGALLGLLGFLERPWRCHPGSSFHGCCGWSGSFRCSAVPRIAEDDSLSDLSVEQAAIRMGAKVEGESHMPGYYAMRDLNVNSNGSWPPYYRENASGGQLSNGFTQNQTNSYQEYDREMLKRTMLEHEAVFRHQVHELHRVYKAQRDLMKDYQDKPICSYMMPADASQTNSFSSQIPPSKTKMAWQMQMAEIVPACGKTPVIELNNKDHSYKFLREGSVQSSSNGVPPSGVAQKSKRSNFDLQLPADCYVDDEDASENKPIDFLGVISNPKPRNDAELTLQNGEDLRRLGGNNSLSALQAIGNQRGKQVADLNEPITGMYFSDSAYRGSVVPKHYHLENSWRNEVRSSTSYFGSRRDNPSNGHADEGTCSNFCDINGKIRQGEKLIIADKGKQASHMNFFAPRFYDTALQKAFKGADERFTRSNQTICSDQNNSVGWLLRNPREATPIHNFPIFDRSDRSCLPPITPLSVPRVDQLSSASPFGSCEINPRCSTNNSPASREIDPRFASSTIDSYTSRGIMTQSMGTLGLKLKNVENLNGSYLGFPEDSFSAMHEQHKIANSSDLEQSTFPVFEHLARQSSRNVQYCNGKSDKNKGFNLNQTPLDGPEDGSEVQDGRCTGSSEHSKGKGFVSGIPWLKRKATCDDNMGLEKSRKAFGYSNVDVLDLEDDKDRKESTPPFHNLSVSASTSQGYIAHRDKINDVAVGVQDSGTFLAPSCHNSASLNKPAAEGVVKKSVSLIRNLIDLNDEVPEEDNSESSVVSHECHTTSILNGNSRRAFKIDLEAPACEEDNKVDILVNVDDTSASVSAAKDIIAMSMDTPVTPDTVDDHMLQWFADLATSNIDDPTKQAETQDCNASCSSDDGSDSFESLTLKLEEAKIDEYWNRPQAPAALIGEETVSAALLLTKPRRGQQRRQRQKRDFQKDILPGLVSLSRHEVTEDFQLLEGLVRASGGSWEMGSGRRGRNGRRARGRKPRKNVEATAEEEGTPASPPAKCGTANLEADGVGMIGWGRTTRRCRRPRCPPGNNATAAS